MPFNSLRFFLEAVNFSPKFLGLSVGTFRNFRGCFRTVRAEFLGLFLDSPDKILGLNIENFWDWFRSLGLGSSLVLIPGLMSSGFVKFFNIIEIC